jgi:hypothetical protein
MSWQYRKRRAILHYAYMSAFEDVRYTHTEVRAGDRLLIKSTCNNCGMSMLLSEADGSLQKWETWHVCDSVIVVPY